jgi:hypothetical protein
MIIDVKLGVRMLIKYPGIALIGMLGTSVAVARRSDRSAQSRKLAFHPASGR